MVYYGPFMPADVQNEKKSLLQMEILFYLDNVHVLGKSEKLFNHIWQQNSNCTGTEFAVVALCCVALNSIRIQTPSFFKVLLCYRKQLPKQILFSWYILSGPMRSTEKKQKKTSSHGNPRTKMTIPD